MDERELLKEIGLSEEELRDLLEKLQKFLATLGHKQKRTFKKSLVSRDEAARSLGDATAEQLEQFIRDRSPEGSFIAIFRRVNGGED